MLFEMYEPLCLVSEFGVAMLTFYSLVVTLRTTRFNIQKFYMALALR